MEPTITIMVVSIPTLRLLNPSRGHQKLFSRDNIRVVRTDDSRIGAPIFKQHAVSATTPNSTAAPPRPPRPTSNQSFWTDSSSILKGGDRGLTHEASTEDLIQQSPVYSNHGHQNGNNNVYPTVDNTLGVPDAGGRDTLKPSTNGKRLTPLEEESSLRGSSVSGGGMMMGNSNYGNHFDSYYGGNNYRSSSKYSTGAFIDTYGTQARGVVEGMELIVPLGQQQQQQYQQQYPQYQQYSQQQQNQSQYQNNHSRQQSSHRRNPSVTEAPMYMKPVTATGGYGGML